ncbi:septum formation initiator family protein [Natroniella sulfidigena]|uniref:FtsB family cell division protein n=1 Tax=Natroniella sulfidigena TaxID=723921 RepID=UPI00200A55CF|nr:septum formation initiator family protein [Natroniella sulfidigena]MCK8817005.1 septum formation initiator family protein [Natroniella sulfidigena]
MKVLKIIKSRLFKVLFLIAGIFFLAGTINNFYQGSLERKRLQEEIVRLEEEIEEIAFDKKELEKQVEHVNSEKFIKQVARSELGLVKEGEMLYIIIDE